MTDDDALREIGKIYAGLPTVQCQGLCFNSCGPIDMSDAERRRIEARGVEIPRSTAERRHLYQQNIIQIGDERLRCAALTVLNRCSVYDVRPLICRIWGVGRGELACEHGCPVTGRRLKSLEVMDLLRQAFQVGGGMDVEQMEWFVVLRDDPEFQVQYGRWQGADAAVREAMGPALRAAYEAARERVLG